MLISMDASSIDMNISTYVFVSYTRKSYLTLDCSSLIKWGSVHYRVQSTLSCRVQQQKFVLLRKNFFFVFYFLFLFSVSQKIFIFFKNFFFVLSADFSFFAPSTITLPKGNVTGLSRSAQVVQLQYNQPSGFIFFFFSRYQLSASSFRTPTGDHLFCAFGKLHAYLVLNFNGFGCRLQPILLLYFPYVRTLLRYYFYFQKVI